MRFEWNDSYSVHDKDIDKHHQRLFEILNRLSISLDDKNTKDTVYHIIDDLFDYATYHFAYEEEIMEQVRYPQLEAHKKAHLLFTSKLKEVANDYLVNYESLESFEIYEMLVQWLKVHILDMDQTLTDYLKDKGGSL